MQHVTKIFLFLIISFGLKAGVLHDLAREGSWNKLKQTILAMNSDVRSDELNSLNEDQKTVYQVIADKHS